MAYVDLNPIRADIAETPEESEFTSIYERIRLKVKAKDDHQESEDVAVPLRPFASGTNDGAAIPYTLSDYLELVDWTGRCIRDDKRGFIDERFPAIAQRLNIDAGAWKCAMRPAATSSVAPWANSITCATCEHARAIVGARAWKLEQALRVISDLTLSLLGGPEPCQRMAGRHC